MKEDNYRSTYTSLYICIYEFTLGQIYHVSKYDINKLKRVGRNMLNLEGMKTSANKGAASRWYFENVCRYKRL